MEFFKNIAKNWGKESEPYNPRKEHFLDKKEAEDLYKQLSTEQIDALERMSKLMLYEMRNKKKNFSNERLLKLIEEEGYDSVESYVQEKRNLMNLADAECEALNLGAHEIDLYCKHIYKSEKQKIMEDSKENDV